MQNPYAMHSFLRLAAPNLPTRIHEDPEKKESEGKSGKYPKTLLMGEDSAPQSRVNVLDEIGCLMYSYSG
jgi:hypothetical protein